MTQLDQGKDGAQNDGETVRPVGAWVVGGFVLTVSFVIWLLVAVIFMHRA